MKKNQKAVKETRHRGDIPRGARTAAGVATGALAGGAFAGQLGAAVGGLAGLLIGFSSDEDDRRNEGW